MIIVQPSSRLPSRQSDGTNTSSKKSSLNSFGRPGTGSAARSAGECMSTSSSDSPRDFVDSASVRTTRKHQSAGASA